MLGKGGAKDDIILDLEIEAALASNSQEGEISRAQLIDGRGNPF